MKKAVIIGYVPLSYAPPLQVIRSRRDLRSVVKWLDSMIERAPHLKGVGWVVDEGGLLSAVLITEEADAVYEHLMWWCEGRPDEFMTVSIIRKDDDSYSLLLAPNPNKSIQRFRRQWGEAVKDMEVSVISCALMFNAQNPSDIFRSPHWPDPAPERLRVGFASELSENVTPRWLPPLRLEVRWDQDTPES